MTANTDDGSINLNSMQLGLNRVFKHNFLEQRYLESPDKDPSLKHLKFKTIFKDEHSLILSRRGDAIDAKKALFAIVDLQPQPE
jgi:hypothetical protein